MSYIESTWYYGQVSKGLVPGASSISTGGIIEDLDLQDTPCDLWNGVNNGAPTKIWQTTAQTLDLVSDNAADNGVTPGAGLQTVVVLGLDVLWNEIQETVTLNGTTPVATVNEFVRVNAVQGVSCGTYHGTNLGLITVTFGTTGDAAAFIEPNIGRDYNCSWSTPDGFDGFLLTPIVSVSLDRWAEIVLRFYTNADQSAGPAYPGASRIGVPIIASRAQSFPLSMPLRVPAMSDIWISIIKASGNNETVSAVFDLSVEAEPS